MTFASIAFKNVRKKLGSYIIYFSSIIFSVIVFHLFCCMYYNPSFANYRFGTGKMSALFRGSAFAVFLFAAVFVLYSGSYFIKTQKKEIAIYSLLGMRKIQIAMMMFLETFFIGLLAIIFGTFIGISLSGYFTSLLMHFMAIGTSVTFSIEPAAILVTVIAFVILFLVSGIRAYKIIYKFSLIDLLSATKQSEGIPGFSPLGAIVSLLLLLSGYLISLTVAVDVGGFHLMVPVFFASVCVLIGTFLLFRNFVPVVIASIKKRKSLYYNTSNFIGISQIAFRLKANSNMLSVIALLTAITITMISASFSFYTALSGDATKSYAPYSYLAKNITQEQHDKLVKTVSDINEISILSESKIELIRVLIQNNQYAVKDQQTGEAIQGKTVDAYLLSQSMYLKIIEETKTAQGTYSETRTDFKGGLNDQSCYFIDGNAVNEYCKDLKGQQVNVSLDFTSNSFTVNGCALHKYIGALDLYKCPTIVVSDNMYNYYYSQAEPENIDTFYGFQFNDNMMSENTVNAINKIIPGRFHIGGLPENMSYIGIYKANFALFGSYAFIGFFLGILFLLASSSVMYYKLIMEAQEEAPRYEILRKTGMKKREILSSIAIQLGIVYGIPLFVGLLHTLFGLLFYNRALGEFGQQTPTLQNAFMVVLLFIFVYGGFYILSVKSYHNIVWKRANAGM